MASNTMTPDVFDKLKKPAMVAHLKFLNLKSGGNVPVLRARFKEWYSDSQGDTASAGPSAEPSDPSVGPSDPSAGVDTEPATATTELDPTIPTTVALLERLFIKKKTSVSQVILDAVHKLQYTPGKGFRRKSQNKDLSDLLAPVGLFTDTFLRVLDSMVLTPKASRNLVSVRINMVKQMPKISADSQLVSFFAAWGIEAFSGSKSPSPRGDNIEELELQRALQASVVSAVEDAARREAEEDDMLLDEPEDPNTAAAAAQAEAEKFRKAILQELDIVNSALMHRLTRWSREFPKPKPEDMHWPNSFDHDERKKIKSFIRHYLDEHDMWVRDIDSGEQSEAIDEMKEHADFPLEHARITAVIQLCFLELRKDRKRYSKTPDSRASSVTSSRDHSPVKQSTEGRSRDEGDDDDEGDQESGIGGAASVRGVGRGAARGASRGRGVVRGASRGRSAVRGASRGRGAGRGAGKRKAAEDDEDDEDDEDAGPVRPKRARRESLLRQSYTRQDLEDEDDNDDDDVVVDEDDNDDGEYAG